jgi:membrane protein implicated in regulation of membrane protease activity
MVPGFHYLTFGGIIALLGGSINYLLKSSPENKYLASLIVLTAIIFVLVAWFTRTFALKAQDRAIRAEENLRHFVLTGKLLPASLRVGQIVALRFASDAEFVALVAKAAAENLSGKEIKQSIQNWKADHYRV